MVGPGQYDPHKGVGESNKGPTWHNRNNSRKSVPGE